MTVLWLGQVEYVACWRLQRELATLRGARRMGDLLLLVEHPPTITLGRGADPRHVLAGPERLQQLGVAVHQIDRGGDVTYHGPGQLVGYPILDLADHRQDLHWFLRQLEEALIAALRVFGIAAERFPPHTGVWFGASKIAAIGIKVSRWISTHGFALNVASDLTSFDLIVPCGIRDYGVCSIGSLLGQPVAVTDALHPVSSAFRWAFPSARPDCGVPTDGLSEDSRKIVQQGLDVTESLC